MEDEEDASPDAIQEDRLISPEVKFDNFMQEFGMNHKPIQPPICLEEEVDAIGNFEIEDHYVPEDNLVPTDIQPESNKDLKIDNFSLVLEANEVDISRDEGRSIRFDSLNDEEEGQQN